MTMEAIILDIACAAFLVLFGVIGLVRGFARQLLSFWNWFAAIIIAFFTFKPLYYLLWDNVAFVRTARDGLAGLFDKVPFIVSMLTNLGTTTVNLANYTFYVVFFIILAILSGIVFSLFRKIVVHFSGTGFWRVFDKIFGFAFGAALGAAILALLFGILYYIVIRFEFSKPVFDFLDRAKGSISRDWFIDIFVQKILKNYIATTPFMYDLYLVWKPEEVHDISQYWRPL